MYKFCLLVLLAIVVAIILVNLIGFILDYISKRVPKEKTTVFNKAFYKIHSAYMSAKNRGLGTALMITIVGGIIVTFFSAPFSKYYDNYFQRHSAVKNIANLRIGLSRSKVDEYLGIPAFNEHGIKTFDVNYDGEVDDWPYTSAGYALDECVVLCMYHEEILNALFVVCNSPSVYKVEPVNNEFLNGKETYLGRFTYNDFYDDFNDEFVEYYALNGQPQCYCYYEMYQGGTLTLNQRVVIGTFGDWGNIEQDEVVYELIDRGGEWCSLKHPEHYGGVSNRSQEELDERMREIRRTAKPNMYGAVDLSISDEFDFPSDLIDNMQNYALLFAK